MRAPERGARTYIADRNGEAMKRMGNNTGFAMIDALVALLLFALVLLAAIAALIQGMRATHAAALTGHAVDLAADFLEQQRALPADADAAALLTTWDERLHTELPESSRPAAQALVQPLLETGAAGAP
jgi:Tfp pilus assembly protein PilV